MAKQEMRQPGKEQYKDTKSMHKRIGDIIGKMACSFTGCVRSYEWRQYYGKDKMLERWDAIFIAIPKKPGAIECELHNYQP